MLQFIIALLLLGLALAAVVVRKTYDAIPLAELKRRAVRHDMQAARLYEAVAYQSSLRGLLWLIVIASSTGGFVLMARVAPAWISFIAIGASLWLASAWLPASRVSTWTLKLTLFVTPSLAWVLNYAHPLLQRLSRLVKSRRRLPHTGMFEREDLEQVIEQQTNQPDSRLSQEELSIVKHVLTFGDHIVRNTMIARGNVRTVHANETVGPILIDELHQTGLEYVLVQDSPNAEIVGTLAVQDLGLHSSGRVRDIMDPTVYYVHESDSLSDALHAFFVTNHPLFIVTNSFEEYVGIITVQQIMHQLIGHVPGEAFDQYANVQAVAARHPKQRTRKKSDELPAEVVE